MTGSKNNRGRIIVSVHAPKAAKPPSQDAFGYFLAGLIDADGHISKWGYVQIDFNVLDISLAYVIKKVIGYGNVSQEKARLSVRYRCTDMIGNAKIADLIRHKLKHDTKIDQFNNDLVPRLQKAALHHDKTIYKVSDLTLNAWAAGFIQGDGSLGLTLYHFKGSVKTSLVVSITQKKPYLLKLLIDAFGGSLNYRQSQDTYSFISNSFTNAAKLINYLDTYQLMSNKLTQYWVWRKAYLIFQDGQHLQTPGQTKLAKLKARLSSVRAAKLKSLTPLDIERRKHAKIKRALNRVNDT
jgi:LAGLIDADG endonuclease